MRGALAAVLLASSFRSTLGATVTSWGDGSAVVELVPGDGLLNLGGTVHGGVLAGLADLAFPSGADKQIHSSPTWLG